MSCLDNGSPIIEVWREYLALAQGVIPGPGIKSLIGLPAGSLFLCLSVSLMKKERKKEKKKEGRKEGEKKRKKGRKEGK